MADNHFDQPSVQRLVGGEISQGLRILADEPNASIVPLDLRDLLVTLRRHAWLIALVTTLSTGYAVYWTRTHAPLYSAQATVRLNDLRREMTGGLADGPISALAGRQVDPVLSLIEVLQSRAAAGQVVDSLPELRVRTTGFPLTLLRGLTLTSQGSLDSITLDFGLNSFLVRIPTRSLPASYGQPVVLDGVRFRVEARPDVKVGTVSVLSREAAIQRLLSSMKVKARDNTNVADVIYMDVDPRLAQRAANQVVQVFKAVSEQTAQQQSVRRRKFLEDQLKYHDSVLVSVRSQLTEFRGRERAFSAQAKFSNEQAGFSGLEVRRGDLDAQRRIIKDLLSQLDQPGSKATDGLGALLSTPDIGNNPTIQQLFTQLLKYQTERDSLTTGQWAKGPTHPDVVRIDKLVAATRQQLLGAFGGLLTSLNARIASLDQLKARSATAFPDLSATEGEEAGLEGQVHSAERTVEGLRTEYEKARLAEAVEVGEVEIVDFAARPAMADGVRATTRMLFGFLFGLVLGISSACLLEYLNTSMRRREQVAHVLQLKELAVIPPFSRSRSGRTRRRLKPGNGRQPVRRLLGETVPMEHDRNSIAAEAYRLLRTNLIFSSADESPRTIAITSACPGEGKTTVAVNLAVAFAHQGIPVLLVDTDLRRGRIFKVFEMAKDPGLSQVLQGSLSLTEAVRSTSVPGLSVLTTGGFPTDPSELLGSPAMSRLVAEVSQQYGMVIFDTSPLLSVPDGAIMAAGADATILVVRAGQTKEDEAKVAMAQLVAVGANVVGAVMNDKDAEMHRYGEYYYSEYYGQEGPSALKR
jgi:succinoglycan biosynthesis transport protein ExoP